LNIAAAHRDNQKNTEEGKRYIRRSKSMEAMRQKNRKKGHFAAFRSEET